MRSTPYLRVLFVSLALSVTTACLKTRAQLRGDEDELSSGQSAPAGKPQKVDLEQSYVVDEMKAEITRMNGRLDDLEKNEADRQKDQKTNKDDDRSKKLEQRIAELEQAQANLIEAFKKLEGSVPPPDQVDVFEKGKKRFEEGEHSEAITLFSQYLKSPNGKFKEEATFLRGESYFASKEYKKAIVDFSQFPEKFSQSARMPKALLRIGISFELMGMKDDSRAFFQELIEKFPKSKESTEARKRLTGRKGRG